MSRKYLLALFLVPFSASAAESSFTGEAELGWVTTTGNSKTQSIAAKAKAEKTVGDWRHDAKFEALNTSGEDSNEQFFRSAERYLFGYKLAYEFSERDYAFGELNHERERFSGYKYRTNGLLGYGRELMKTDTLKLNGEVSVGARKSSFEERSGTETEKVVKLLGNLGWAISETATFNEELSFDIGDDSTISKSISSLSVKINSDLAMKLSYTYRNTSKVPAGNEKTDTETVMTLVYSY